MKKLTFKVTNPKENSLIALIKEGSNINCRIQFDIENGIVTVEDVKDTEIGAVIDLINNYYTIETVDIDNRVEVDSEPVTDTEVETDYKSVAEAEIEAELDSNPVAEVELETEVDSELATETKFVGPQSEDEVIFDKIKFENKYIEHLMNNMLRTIYWSIYKMDVPEKEIGDFILTFMNEISMRYNWKKNIKFCVGDVVDCNFGMHLQGEINGGHVNAIVCHISEAGMAYLVPITKLQTNLTSHSYLTITPRDITWKYIDYECGTALLDKGKYVHSKRFRTVIGKTSEYFFKKLLKKLSTTFDFTNDISITKSEFYNGAVEGEVSGTMDEQEDESELDVENQKIDNVNIDVESCQEDKKGTDVGMRPSEEVLEELLQKVKKNTDKAIINNADVVLLENFGNAFYKLNPSKKVEEQIDSFLEDIGMPTNDIKLKETFVIACDIKKITYSNIVTQLHEKYPKSNIDLMESGLKETYKEWLKKYPEIVEKCHTISLMSLLKLFTKIMA